MIARPSFTYEEALAHIAGLAPRGWRLGLDRMAEFVRRAGLEEAIAGRSPRFVHVAGTNGKGSTTAFVQSLLVAGGFKTGAYYSPFVYDPRERWQFEMAPISKNDLAEIACTLAPIGDSLGSTEFGGVTEFEFKTTVGFEFWQRKSCDWVALEVGLGGRLDATNVVTPAVSIVVSIGLDHTAILGAELGLIAAEKAGIVKPGAPTIMGRLAAPAAEVVEAAARAAGSPIWQMDRDIAIEPTGDGEYRVRTPIRVHDGLTSGVVGARQPHNMALAVAALDAAGVEISDQAVRDGVRAATAPGRFQRSTFAEKLIVLDGAHNEDASKALGESLAETYPNQSFCLLTGMVLGHDPERFFAPLADVVHEAHVTPIGFYRGMPTSEVAAGLKANGIDARVHASVDDALNAAAESKMPILATGSNYLLGELGPLIGL